ncbi:hypothetical protein NDU88_003266 [Pleurodeles waltl]|uniref:Uncharacterized protein n=1 Tax=Pleurodeles waltl TaxID=8319 RepID=A0AAV7MRA5_PLEWA|nr:hypothetical protein NDU88_003266 [Pleurodeles waltl]
MRCQSQLLKRLPRSSLPGTQVAALQHEARAALTRYACGTNGSFQHLWLSLHQTLFHNVRIDSFQLEKEISSLLVSGAKRKAALASAE